MLIFSFIIMDMLRLLFTVVFADKSLFFMILLQKNHFLGQIILKVNKTILRNQTSVYKRDFKSSPI